MLGRSESLAADASTGIRCTIDQVQQLTKLGTGLGVAPEDVVLQPEVAVLEPDILGEDRSVGEHQGAPLERAVEERVPCQMHGLTGKGLVLMLGEWRWGSLIVHAPSLATLDHPATTSIGQSWGKSVRLVDKNTVIGSLTRFIFDPGLPYVVAGILMLLAAGLIPSQLEMTERRANLEELRSELEAHKQREEAYGLFLDELAKQNPTLSRRLVAAQLGLVPVDAQPIIISSQLNESPTRWVERTVALGSWAPDEPAPTSSMTSRAGVPFSTLSRMSTGGGRLWLFGAALISIFIGLLLNPADPTLEDRVTPLEA